MLVSINVEFEVSSNEELDENAAKQAAELAVYHYAVFIRDGVRVCRGEVPVDVDGQGKCQVKFAER